MEINRRASGVAMETSRRAIGTRMEAERTGQVDADMMSDMQAI